MRFFVTVGTTRFDALVSLVLSDAFLHAAHAHGYTYLTLQHGKSPLKELAGNLAAARLTSAASCLQNSLVIDAYDYKPSLADDMAEADCVLSHAGSGTILEALLLHKERILVVVNEDLMDNHQLELATELSRQGYLLATTVPCVMSTLFPALSQPAAKNADNDANDNFIKLRPWAESDPNVFWNAICARMNIPRT